MLLSRSKSSVAVSTIPPPSIDDFEVNQVIIDMMGWTNFQCILSGWQASCSWPPTWILKLSAPVHTRGGRGGKMSRR